METGPPDEEVRGHSQGEHPCLVKQHDRHTTQFYVGRKDEDSMEKKAEKVE